jgi:anti-sigma B factor antagonist
MSEYAATRPAGMARTRASTSNSSIGAVTLVFAAVGRDADPPAFTLDSRAEGDRTIVSVAGEVDLATAEQMAAGVRDALAAGAVTLDLSAVVFMDSAGVRALNTALRDAAHAGSELTVRQNLQPAVVQVLELTGMLGLLRLEAPR